MMKVLTTSSIYVPTAFEMAFPPPVGSTTGGCEADAMVRSRILEFKSGSPNLADTDVGSLNDGDFASINSSIFTTFMNNSFSNVNTNSYTQLLCYLRSINNMNNLRYIFDKDLLLSKGQTDPLAYVRQAFQTLFQRPVEQQQIFNTIWNNLLLRQSLFTRPATATTIDIWRIDAQNQFTAAINNSTFFNFVTVH